MEPNMFHAGQSVEVADGAFVGQIGVVISHTEAAQRVAQQAAQRDFIVPAFSAPANAVFVVITIWGGELVLELMPNQVRAVERPKGKQ